MGKTFSKKNLYVLGYMQISKLKQLIFFKQNPVLNGYHKESELEDILKSGNHKSLLGYNDEDWFVDEVVKSEIEMAFYFKNIKKDNIMTEDDEEDYENDKIRRFYEKQLNLIKLEIIIV